MSYDLIIRGASIADGSGAPLFDGDVAVKNGKIAAVGEVSGKGKEEIDARGLLVTPGFVDIHTHYDGQATWEERLVPSSWHGVTTTAFGNCGVGFAPVRRSDRQSLIELMEGVEEIPGSALHEGLKDAGSGVMQMIGEFTPDDRDEEIAMLHRIMRASGRPLSVIITQRHRDPEGWRDMLAGLEAAHSEGLEMRAQVAPRSIGSMYGLSLSQHAFYLHPSYKEIADKPLAEKVAIMRDPAFRAKLLAEKPVHRSQRLVERTTNFDFTFALGNPPDYEPPEERSIRNLAAQAGRDPMEFVYDLLLENDGKNFLFSPNTNYAGYNLDASGEMIRHPLTCLGLSDGGAHVGHISDSGYPTFLLTHWGRDRKSGRIELPWLVRWMTSATAETVGLYDRGRIAPGYRADLNVIDFDRLGQSYPYLTYDLPENGKRFMQKGEGYVATFLGGVATYRDGEPTDALPGKLVRGPQGAPAVA